MLNADLIRTRREALGWSQNVLAQHMGITPQTAWRWENDPPASISHSKALTLARMLEVEVGALFVESTTQKD